MSKPEHSPLPWASEENNKFWIVDTEGKSVADLYHAGSRVIYSVRKRNDEANANFIVTACNSYYDNQAAIAELVEALEQFEMHYPMGINTFLNDAANKARTLIAKHKAVKP